MGLRESAQCLSAALPDGCLFRLARTFRVEGVIHISVTGRVQKPGIAPNSTGILLAGHAYGLVGRVCAGVRDEALSKLRGAV